MLAAVQHPTTTTLEAGLDHVRQAPADRGWVELIVRRPAENEREVLAAAELDRDEGLVGDTWRARSSSSTPDGSAHPDRQVTLMSSRAAQLVALEADRWQLAGDQLFLDLDLSEANLPAGTRLELGSAVIEITEQPHLGCAKFAARFGRDALRFVNSAAGRALRLRGVNAKVIVAGSVRTGDEIRKLPPDL
jgi:MOSC domain-containing protein YiiM